MPRNGPRVPERRAGPQHDDGNDRPLLVELVRDGEVTDHQDIHEARRRHAASRAELPRAATQLSRGEAVIPTIFEEP